MLSFKSLSRPNCFPYSHPRCTLREALCSPWPTAWMPVSEIPSSNSAYASNPRAKHLTAAMRDEGIYGDSYTCSFVLKACGMIKGLREGRTVHGEVVKRGDAGDSFVVNELVGMYGKCGEMGYGRKVFDEFGGKDLVGWYMVLSGYVGCEMIEEARKMFDEMP